MKNTIKVAVLAMLGFIVSVNVYQSQTDIDLTEIQLDNVEALADKTPTSIYSCVYGGIFCNLFLNGEEVFTSTEHRAQY